MEPFIGQIQTFGFNFAPRGWALCNGQLLPISSNSALFSLLGTTYGGDGRTTFGLPDLRGRAAIHFGQGPGLPNYVIGSKGGAPTVTLNATQMPSHTHVATLRASHTAATVSKPENNVLGSSQTYHTPPTDVNMGSSINVANAGGNQAHDNMQPYLTINWCIALTGTFPSRN